MVGLSLKFFDIESERKTLFAELFTYLFRFIVFARIAENCLLLFRGWKHKHWLMFIWPWKTT